MPWTKLHELDYDLGAALADTPEAMPTSPIVDVLASIPGENEGSSWHWITVLEDGTFAYTDACCDYTGWG